MMDSVYSLFASKIKTIFVLAHFSQSQFSTFLSSKGGGVRLEILGARWRKFISISTSCDQVLQKVKLCSFDQNFAENYP